MDPAVLFKDLGKRISDLFTKEFPLNERKIEWKSDTVQGATFETNFNQKGDSIFGTLMPKYNYRSYGLNIMGEFSTKKEAKVEVSADDIAPGVKAIASVQSKNDELFGTLSTEYKHQSATVTALAELGKPKGTLIKTSVVVSPGRGFSLGASSEYLIGATEQSDLAELNTALGYYNKQYEVNLFGRIKHSEDKHEMGANFFHQASPATAVAGEMCFDVRHTDRLPKFTVGVQHKWSPVTTLKSKLDTMGALGLSYQQIFPNQTKLTLATSVDLKNLSEKSSKFGVGLSFNF